MSGFCYGSVIDSINPVNIIFQLNVYVESVSCRILCWITSKTVNEESRRVPGTTPKGDPNSK